MALGRLPDQVGRLGPALIRRDALELLVSSPELPDVVVAGGVRPRVGRVLFGDPKVVLDLGEDDRTLGPVP